MVKLASFVLAACSTLLSISAANAAPPKPIALVYQGPGGCTYWGCNEAAANVALSMGFDVKMVTPAHLTPEIFEGATLWMQPGGNAITVAQKIGPKGLALIRNFVKNGGAYVGFCAGAFLADSTVDNPETIKGLGILPVGTADYPIDSEPAGIPIKLNWNGQVRTLYFEGGGYFLTHGKNKTSDYTVFAWFPNGDAAALETAYGRGGVVVTGAHPEAPEKWKTDGGWHDPDGSDVFLAQDMIRRALRNSLPPVRPQYQY